MPSGARSISCTNSSVSGALEATNRFAVIGPAIAVGSSKRIDSSSSSGPVGLVTSPPVFEPARCAYAWRREPLTQLALPGVDRTAVEGQRPPTLTYASVNCVWPSGKPSESISPTARPSPW